MGDYFKPRRRKIGVMTLGITCLFALTWVRSQYTVDVFSITHSRWQHYFFSDNFGLWWETDIIEQNSHKSQRSGGSSNWYFQSSTKSSIHPESPDFEFAANPDMVLTLFGFHVATLFSKNEQPEILKSTWIIPYYSIVMPLTLLSAWLLLSRPRLANPTAISEKSIRNIGRSMR